MKIQVYFHLSVEAVVAQDSDEIALENLMAIYYSAK